MEIILFTLFMIFNFLALVRVGKLTANGEDVLDTLENLVYTTEEYDYRESKNGLCDTYIKENVILFMQGEKDINDDKEWTAFKDQLKKLERPQLMKTIQDAYNRKVGK